MSTTHTPGRLLFTEDGRAELDNQCQILETENGKLIVYFRFSNREDARRLAACWNACDGLLTESLERGAPLADQLVDALNQAHQAGEMRDELLEALQACTDFLEPMRFDRPSDDARAVELDKLAHAAIAKATGAQP